MLVDYTLSRHQMREAAVNSPYSQDYLSLLARTGRLEAIKRDRIWYTTQQVVKAYQQSLKIKSR